MATITQVNQILSRRLPQSGAQLGNPNTPLTMTYWGVCGTPCAPVSPQSAGFSQLLTEAHPHGRG